MKINSIVVAALLTTGLTSIASAQDITVGYISPIAAQPGQQFISAGMEKAITSLGWKWRLLDANLSADRQVSHVDTLLTLGVRAIASWSLDPNAVAGAYARANAQNVPVIGVNSTGEGVTNTVWWEVNTCEPDGPYEQQAAWINERAPGAKVIVMGGPPVPSITSNVACFTAAAKAAGLDVIDQIDNTRDSAANASTLASDELLRFPDVQAVWAYNDQSALGFSAAINASGGKVYGANGPEGVMVFGVNADPDAIEAVRDGRLTGTWDPDSFATGIAVAKAIQAAIETPDAPQVQLTVKSTLFTADNIGTWVPDLERPYDLENIPLTQ